MFSPLNWLLIFLVLSLIIRKGKWKKIFIWASVIIFLVFSCPALYILYARWWQPQPVKLPANTHYSFAVVAGGFASVDEKGDGYFNTASDRFLQAMKLYHSGVVDHILISGGNSKKNDKEFREGSWAKIEMEKMGIPDSVIFVEDKSRDTKENAVNSKNILDSLSARPPYVLITSAFHLPRAQKLFEGQGLKVIGYPCNYTEGRGPVTSKDLIPDPGTLQAWGKYIKETAWRIIKG